MDAIHQVRYSGELSMNPVVAMARAHTAMEYVGLGELRYRQIPLFNGNEASNKVGLFNLYDPELIIADEPSNGLDADSRQAMLDTLSNMNATGNNSVLMASHLMDDVERVCENIVLLHKGN